MPQTWSGVDILELLFLCFVAIVVSRNLGFGHTVILCDSDPSTG